MAGGIGAARLLFYGMSDNGNSINSVGASFFDGVLLGVLKAMNDQYPITLKLVLSCAISDEIALEMLNESVIAVMTLDTFRDRAMEGLRKMTIDDLREQIRNQFERGV